MATTDDVLAAFTAFRDATMQHLITCVDSFPDKTILGALLPEEVAALRARAADTRVTGAAPTPDGSHATAALLEAHAHVGEALWDVSAAPRLDSS